MLYLLETELYENKSIFFSLQSIYGVGNSNALYICKKLGFSKNLKVKHLTEEQIIHLINLIESSNITITSNLKKIKSIVLKNLVFIK